MSEKDQEPPDNNKEELPNKCPVCNQVEEKLVLHLSRNSKCCSNIVSKMEANFKKKGQKKLSS